MKNSRTSTLIIISVFVCSAAVLDFAIRSFAISQPASFGLLLGLALAASRLQLTLPGIEGNMAVNLPFILLALAKLSLGEAVVIVGLSALVQCLPHQGSHLRPVQYLFNVCNFVNTAGLSWLVLHHGGRAIAPAGSPAVALAAAAFLIADTIPVALIIAATEKLNAAKIWRDIFRLTFPYFVLSAGLSAIVLAAWVYVGWYALGVLPVMYAVYRSFQGYWNVAATA